MKDMTPPFTFVIKDVLSIAVFSFTVHNLKTETAAMEDTKKSQRNHPYTRKDSKRKKTAKQAAKDKLKGIIFVDALSPKDMKTSEYAGEAEAEAGEKHAFARNEVLGEQSGSLK